MLKRHAPPTLQKVYLVCYKAENSIYPITKPSSDGFFVSLNPCRVLRLTNWLYEQITDSNPCKHAINPRTLNSSLHCYISNVLFHLHILFSQGFGVYNLLSDTSFSFCKNLKLSIIIFATIGLENTGSQCTTVQVIKYGYSLFLNLYRLRAIDFLLY